MQQSLGQCAHHVHSPTQRRAGPSTPAKLLSSGRHHNARVSRKTLKVSAVAQVTKTSTNTATSTNTNITQPTEPTQVTAIDSLDATLAEIATSDEAAIVAAKVSAVASKITAARELARRLSEEKQAAVKSGEQPEVVRSAEEASAIAAAQAARADALARALRKAENTRDQLQRLKAENEALKELLIEMASDKEAAQSRLAEVSEAAAAAARPSMSPVSKTPSLSPTREATAAAIAATATVAEPPAAAASTVTPTAPPAAAPPAAAAAAAAAVAAAAPPTTEAPEAPTTTQPEVEAEEQATGEQQWLDTPAVAGAALPAVEQPAEPAAVEVLQEPVTVPAPRGMLQLRPPRPDHVWDRIKALPTQIQQLASLANKQGSAIFSVPRQPVPVDGPVRLFYNRAAGPIPPGCSMVVKLGLNKWDMMQDLDMIPSPDIPRSPTSDWWEVTLDLPAEVFRVDFVMYDRNSRQYDNNASRDYKLELADAPTELQLLEKRIEAYKSFEHQRIAYLMFENEKLWRAVEIAALQAAGVARIEFRQKRELQLRAEAESMVAQRRRVELLGLPVKSSQPGVFAWVEGPVAGKKAFLAYNKAQGAMARVNSVRLHIGYDGWWNQIKQVVDMSPMSPNDVQRAGLKSNNGSGHQEWFGCWVDVPHSAMVLDFVLSDFQQAVWDNNRYQDYHTKISGAHDSQQLKEVLYQSLQKENEEKDKDAEDRVARRAYFRIISRGDALRKRRGAVNDFLYTVPYVPVAGQQVEVYYNPEHTPLRGRPNIFMRASFNRSSRDAPQQNGVATIKMEPTIAGGIGFYTAELTVPEDGWSLDLTFIDTADRSVATGFYDDNGGLEYHMPVADPHNDGDGAVGAVSLPVKAPLKVVHVAVEMAPIAKVGGMGDVVTALGRAVQEEGHSVEVIIPKYDCINYKQVEDLRQTGSFAHGGTTVRVWKGLVEGLQTTFLEPENGHFWRGVIYGRNDDHVRFAFLCSAALAYLQTYNIRPNILHCHDWQSAPIAWGQRGASRCVFTIHNLGYGADLIGRAMASCEVATTVSPTYASEISGQPGIAPHLGKFFGIRNGIDADTWNPMDDPYLPIAYGPDDAVEGKAAARKELRRRLALNDIDVPIVACVTRLVAQKGIHLIKHAAWRTMERGGQFVLLGSAPDARVQAEFNALRDQLKAQYHDRAALVFTYDEPLSHLIYAGSDMFLVPSMFEPCGLTQMIAMQYGTIPVVRKTGGLADTVFDLDHDEERAAAAGMEPNGFMFEGTDTAGMDYALNRALSMWYSDRLGWARLTSRVMRQDWSWFSPALDYVEIYYRALRS